VKRAVAFSFWVRQRQPIGEKPAMEWMFLVTSRNRARVEARVLQVLEHHMTSLQSFAAMRIGNEVRITFIVDTEPGGAIRIRELLNKLQDVDSVDSFAMNDGMCQTLALFKVLCDQESRLPLLQVISSVGAQVVAMRPDSIAFQVVGTPQDIEGLHASLLPYGLVDAISVASAAVRKQPSVRVSDNVPLPRIASAEQNKKQTGVETKALRHVAFGSRQPGVIGPEAVAASSLDRFSAGRPSAG
jgi:acetolactate synthase small subunit